MGKIRKCPKVKDGAIGIVFVKNTDNILNQKIVLVKDHDDRKRGDGILMLGLPGGGIEFGENPIDTLKREFREEINFNSLRNTPEEFGCYSKLRPGGVTNKNHLFILRLNSFSKRTTNDPNEVSQIVVLSIREFFTKAHMGLVHEGSIRLMIHFLNGKRTGSLNEEAQYGQYHF